MLKFSTIMAVLAMVMAPVSAAWAVDGVKILGSYIDPISGQSTQFVKAESTDAIRHNQTVIYAMTTDQELVTLPNGKKRWQPTTKMVAHDNAQSTGIVNGFFVGGFAGLAQGGGLVGGAALIRPSNVNQSNSGGNASQSQGQNMKQKQQQQQGQNQTINADAGIGNTNNVTGSFNGVGNVGNF